MPLLQRCIHELPEVPVLFYLRHTGRDPSLSQLSSNPEPPANDSIARRGGLLGLRLVRIRNSAILALRRVVAVVAATDYAKRVRH